MLIDPSKVLLFSLLSFLSVRTTSAEKVGEAIISDDEKLLTPTMPNNQGLKITEEELQAQIDRMMEKYKSETVNAAGGSGAEFDNETFKETKKVEDLASKVIDLTNKVEDLSAKVENLNRTEVSGGSASSIVAEDESPHKGIENAELKTESFDDKIFKRNDPVAKSSVVEGEQPKVAVTTETFDDETFKKDVVVEDSKDEVSNVVDNDAKVEVKDEVSIVVKNDDANDVDNNLKDNIVNDVSVEDDKDNIDNIAVVDVKDNMDNDVEEVVEEPIFAKKKKVVQEPAVVPEQKEFIAEPQQFDNETFKKSEEQKVYEPQILEDNPSSISEDSFKNEKKASPFDDDLLKKVESISSTKTVEIVVEEDAYEDEYSREPATSYTVPSQTVDIPATHTIDAEEQMDYSYRGRDTSNDNYDARRNESSSEDSPSVLFHLKKYSSLLMVKGNEFGSLAKGFSKVYGKIFYDKGLLYSKEGYKNCSIYVKAGMKNSKKYFKRGLKIGRRYGRKICKNVYSISKENIPIILDFSREKTALFSDHVKSLYSSIYMKITKKNDDQKDIIY